MNMEAMRHFFAWCSVINYAILILWCVLTLWVPGWRSIVTRLFGQADEKFGALNFAGIMYYKLGIILFNLVPYIALRIMA